MPCLPVPICIRWRLPVENFPQHKSRGKSALLQKRKQPTGEKSIFMSKDKPCILKKRLNGVLDQNIGLIIQRFPKTEGPLQCSGPERVKKLFDTLSNGKHFVGFPFEKACVLLRAQFVCRRPTNSTLAGRSVRFPTYTPPENTIYILFRRARRNSTRFLTD